MAKIDTFYVVDRKEDYRGAEIAQIPTTQLANFFRGLKQGEAEERFVLFTSEQEAQECAHRLRLLKEINQKLEKLSTDRLKAVVID